MIQIAANVYVESNILQCNLGLVTTSEGNVMIDTPNFPTGAVKWRDEIAKKGKLRYVITTEEHLDHCTNSWFFSGLVISSEETRQKLAKVSMNEIKERVRQRDPAGLALMDSFQVRLADIAFTGSLDLHLGDHTFRLFPLPGHSSGGIGVFIPEERVVFTADCVFCRVKTWLQEALPEQWRESLRKIGELDVDSIVPGHGSICNKSYLTEQATIVQNWVEMVKSAINQGLSEDEVSSRMPIPDPYPKQPTVFLSESEINKRSIARLYQLYSR